MKYGLIVLCRYNSSRLPGKILKELNGKPLIAYILERLQHCKETSELVVATSNEPTDNPIEAWCRDHGVKCFRGSLQDVAGRFLACAVKYNMDYAIRINGDNIFTDHRQVDQMILQARKGNYQFVTNVKDRTFPTGMSVEIVQTPFYKEQYPNFTEARYKEHVTLYFYEHPEVLNAPLYVYNHMVPAAKGLKLAVDSPEDFRFAARLLKNMQPAHTDYGLQEITELIKKLK